MRQLVVRVFAALLCASAASAQLAPRSGSRTDDTPKAAPLFAAGGISGDIRAWIDRAKPEAAASRRNLLIIWGSATDPACDRLREVMDTSDNARIRRTEFLETWAEIAAGPRADANIKLAEEFAASPAPGKLPWLTILDSTGATLESIDGQKLLDPTRSKNRPTFGVLFVQDFLNKHLTPRLVVQDELDRAKRLAADQSKGLLIIFTQVEDAWSDRFRSVLADAGVAAALSPHFVTLEIELTRTQGGWEELARHIESPQSLPLLAALNPDGTAAAVSQPKGQDNFGFPSDDAELDRLIALLKSGRAAFPGKQPEPDWSAIRAAFQSACATQAPRPAPAPGATPKP